MTLRWEKQPQYGNIEGWWAYSGDLIVGMVGNRQDGSFWYKLDAVHTRWITKGYGDVKSIRAAKQAVERAWATWLDRAGLMSRTDVDGVRYGLNAAADYLEGSAEGAAAIATVNEQAGDTAAAAEHRAEERWARTYSEQIRELRADVVKTAPRS